MIAYDNTLKRLTFRDNAAWRVMDTAVIVRKTGEETVNNSNVLQNDDELLLAMAANEVWSLELFLLFNSSTVADLKLSATMPAGCVGLNNSAYNNDAIAITVDENVISALALGGAGASNRLYRASYLIINGGNAGNFQIQWAQNTAEATNTKVLTNSHLICRKLA
jgi:hypothetical protein